MKTIICRVPTNSISGYQKIIKETLKILFNNYDVILLPLDNHSNFVFDYKVGKLTKETFKFPEIIISPLYLDRYSSLTNLLPDKDNINILTMWESTVLPKFPTQELNCSIKKVFVPSLWNKGVFEISGVKNVDHLPLFVDDNFFNYMPKKNLNKFTFSTGACKSTSTGNDKRKNFNFILSAFRKAFKGIRDVELKLKLSICDKPMLGNILDDRIHFEYNHLSDINLRDYVCESDVFVSSSKGEGWGFFQIESLAIGRPVITVNFGGIKDFCNENNSIFIDYEEELASGGWGKNGGCWAEMKEDSLIEKMLYCYNNKDQIRNNWQKYSESVLPKFSLSSYENNLINKIDQI